MRGWRFYDQFRTDLEAPARMPQVGTHTPVLSNDGSDLAAAIQTILEIGNPVAFNESITDAFPDLQFQFQPLTEDSKSRCDSTGCSGL
jgi:predicted ATPase